MAKRIVMDVVGVALTGWAVYMVLLGVVQRIFLPYHTVALIVGIVILVKASKMWGSRLKGQRR